MATSNEETAEASLDSLHARWVSNDLDFEDRHESWERDDGSEGGRSWYEVRSANGAFPHRLCITWQELDKVTSTELENWVPLDEYLAIWDGGCVIEIEVGPASEVQRLFPFRIGRPQPPDVKLETSGDCGFAATLLASASPELRVWRAAYKSMNLISMDQSICSIRFTFDAPLRDRVTALAEVRRGLTNVGYLHFRRDGVGLLPVADFPCTWSWSSDDVPTVAPDNLAPEEPLYLLLAQAAATHSGLTLRFLAFYRVLEYFFGVGPSESDEIKRVVKEACTHDELRGFLGTSKERNRYYRRPASEMPLVKRDVPVDGNDDAALRDLMAQRLYKIRCRIVHSKGCENPLLPTDPEIPWLRFDLEVLEFIVQQLVERRARKLAQP